MFRVGAATAQVFPWVKSAGDAGEDAGLAITTDAAGHLYAAGHFSAQATFGEFTLRSGDATDVFLLKAENEGRVLWARRFGGIGLEECTAVAAAPDGSLFLAGSFNGQASFDETTLTSVGSSDVLVAKLDGSGRALWAVGAGGPAKDVASGLAVDGWGNSSVTGEYRQRAQFGSTILPASTAQQVFVARYNPTGALVWARNSGGGEAAAGFGVAADGAGNTWTVGEFFPLAPLAMRNSDAFVMRSDPEGKVVWYRTWGGAAADSAHAVALDTLGNCSVTGYFNGTAKFGNVLLQSRGDRDVFVFKCDLGGHVVWARRAGGGSTDVGSPIAVDGAGSCFVGGYFIGGADFGPIQLDGGGSADAFVMKLTTDGQPLWAIQAGGTANMDVYGLAVDRVGRAYLTGYFRSSSPFGGFFLANQSTGRDIFLARLDSPPLPKLSILRVAERALVSWPAELIGFRLESSTNLSLPTAWRLVPEAPTRQGDRNVLTNRMAEDGLFYRLRK